MKSAGHGTWSIALLLSILGVCVAQITLEACGDDNADVTCSFFFNKLNRAFRDESVLYTLRKSFFPTKGVVPTVFDVFMTIGVENVPDISCTDPEFVLGERTIDNPPTMNEVCGDISVTTTEVVQVIQNETVQVVRNDSAVEACEKEVLLVANGTNSGEGPEFQMRLDECMRAGETNITTTITANTTVTRTTTSTKYTCNFKQWTWKHLWSKTIINHIIEAEDLQLLQDTNFVAFAAAAFNSFDTSVFSQPENIFQDETDQMNSSLASAGNAAMSFFLTLDFLPCSPDDGVLLDAWEDILPWIELYAKNSDNLENVEYNQEARGFAFDTINKQKGDTLPLLTIIHVLLNAVFALAATYMFSKYHKELNKVTGKRYQMIASIYWAVVFLCFAGATVITVGNAYLYYALTFFDKESKEALGFRLTSDITVVIIAVIEFIVSILTPHEHSFFIPHLIRRTLTCNQCFSCCGSQGGRHLLRKAILSVAMWIIILFFQLIISSLLPLAVVVIRNPVPSLAFLSIMASLFFCLIVFLAYFLNAFEGNYIMTHKLTKQERRRSSLSLELLKNNPNMAGDWARDKLILVAQAFIFLVTFCIVSIAIIIYLNFVRAGADVNSATGLIFSIAPSIVLGGIAWAAKKHLFREFEEEQEEGASKDEDDKEQSTSFIQFGKFSIGPHVRRATHRSSWNKMSSTEITPHSPISPSADVIDYKPAATTVTIDMEGSDSDAARDGTISEENVSLQEGTDASVKKNEEGEEEEEERKERDKDEEEVIAKVNGDPLVELPNEKSKSHGHPTPQKRRISFAMDEYNVFTVPNNHVDD